MSYKPTFAELKARAEDLARNLEYARTQGVSQYDRYISLKGAMTNAELAASFSPTEDVTEADIANLAALLQTALEFSQFATNAAVSQGDRRYSWLKFL